MPALDLNRAVPRSPFDELEGFPWLPRLIDKARANFAGTNGEYTPYPSPGDKQFLGFFGIDAKKLGELIKSGADDAAIAAFVKSHATRQDAETFRKRLFNPPSNPILRFLIGLFLRLKIRKLLQVKPGTDVSRIDTLAMFLVVEEGHPYP